MKFTVDYDTLDLFLRQMTKGKARKYVKTLRVWACDARMFVGAGWMVTGTEALVLEDGGCTVDRRQFESLFRVFGLKKNITIEAKSGLLQIEDERIKATDYSEHVTAPGEFKVFPVTDMGVISESKGSLGRDKTG